jgi:pimeloyl-ACP methyl ester carboxylesterase
MTGTVSPQVRRALLVVASAALMVACSSQSDPTAAPAGSPGPTEHLGPVADLHVECWGEGSPTVVLIAGLNTPGDTFADLQEQLAASTRTCSYDRAGIGSSSPLDDGAPDPSPGSAAADLRASLAEQGIAPPYVVVGWSYGGLVAQAYAMANGDQTVGLVLEDTSVREQFTDPQLKEVDEEVGVQWSEGGRDIDVDVLKDQLAELDFGDVPLVVLSQAARGAWGRAWLDHHDDLARASRDGVHVVGVGSGHAMHEDVPDLVTAAVLAVAEAATSTRPLDACDPRLTAAGGQCRDLDRP